MGGCCPCWKSSDETNEYTPIPRGEPQHHSTEIVPPVEANSSQYYQTVIDIAQKKFISATTQQRLFTRDDKADELRNKLSQANLPVSPPQKRSFLQLESNNSSQQVVDILSAPIVVNNYDVVADELAEMAATYTFKIHADDTTNPTVASFRPSVTTSS